MVARWGVHGCWGVCVWLLGGMRGCQWVHGCWGVCMVVGGACMVVGGGACMGYNEIRSMSRWYASYWNAFLLPSANEVWGKVIFSQACVIPSVHRGGGVGFPPCTGKGGWLPSMHWGVCFQNWEKRVVRILLEWLSCKRYDYSQTIF